MSVRGFDFDMIWEIENRKGTQRSGVTVENIQVEGDRFILLLRKTFKWWVRILFFIVKPTQKFSDPTIWNSFTVWMFQSKLVIDATIGKPFTVFSTVMHFCWQRVFHTAKDVETPLLMTLARFNRDRKWWVFVINNEMAIVVLEYVTIRTTPTYAHKR